MPRSGGAHSGLAMALREIFNELPARLENFPQFAHDIFETVIGPAFTILIVFGLLGIVINQIRKVIFPPTSQELHHDALLLLQKRDTRNYQKEAIRLLQKASSEANNYVPAQLSLAAYYLYCSKPPNAKGALQILQQIVDNNEHNNYKQQIESLKYDAEAIVAGNGHMVFSTLREQEFLSLSYATTTSSCSRVTATTMATSAASDNNVKCNKNKDE